MSGSRQVLSIRLTPPPYATEGSAGSRQHAQGGPLRGVTIPCWKLAGGIPLPRPSPLLGGSVVS